jgi:hypothetical protein
MKTENLKIGITLGLKSNTETIWTNGIKQNVLMLVHLLQNSKKNYEVCILNIFDVDFTVKPSYLKDIDIHYFDEKFMEMDLIISMGGQILDSHAKKFRKDKNKKIVSYKCGNNYVLTMEEIIFKESKSSSEVEQEIDELWYIPQQDEVNRGYYTTLHRTNSLIVPFVWHQKFLYEKVVEIEKGYKEGIYKKGWQYNPNKKKKIIGVMEPNINIVKFCLIPTMIVEESYRGKIGKKLIDKLRLTNAIKLKDNKLFMSLIKTFDLFKDNKITAESRFQTAYVLTQHLDVLVCHQVLNPLNYLYLDAVFLGYPVLHNAPLCKDLGYYYEGSDTKEGAKMLDHILKNHDKNLDSYDERNDLVLQRYHADNEDLVANYDKLIENLWKGGNKNTNYNSETNLLEWKQ